jgi:putative nucleotidyltransferase with HDIG domain
MSSGTAGMSLDQLRDAITELPTIPETLTRILELLEDPASGARDLAAVIRADAPLASKILRLANSPLYQKNRDITSVQECVSVLGYRTVRQVALCVAVISGLGRECSAKAGALDYRELWQHSVNVGAIAHALARRDGTVDPETVFLGGLLHDLGKFVLTICEPRLYGEIIANRRAAGVPLVTQEQGVLGFDHTEAGAVLADAWNFPRELQVVIRGHHHPDAGDHAQALVAAADVLANTLRPANSDLGYCASANGGQALLDAVGLPADLPADLRSELKHAMRDAASLVNLD